MKSKNPNFVPIDWDFVPLLAKLCQLQVLQQELVPVENTGFHNNMRGYEKLW